MTLTDRTGRTLEPGPRAPPRADAVIVGAGPAGTVTALLLARQGLEVVLVDRADFPRPKPCGDCLSAAATGLLRRLDLLERVRDAGATVVEHWKVVAPDGTVATGTFGPATALALERRRLDAALLDAAREDGVRFQRLHVTSLSYQDGRVSGIRGRDRAGSVTGIDARLVVGADGLRSVVARRLDVIRRPPRLRKASFTIHIPAPAAGLRHGEMHVVDGAVIGYAPAGTGRCNLTVVLVADRLAEEAGREPIDLIRAAVELAPGLRGRVHPDPCGPVLASGPFDWPTRSPVARGAALVGDAAGYYDPFTGQGIHHAMEGAVRLAEAVGPALSTRDPDPRTLDRHLRRYARDKRRLTLPARAVQRVVEWTLASPRRANAALGRLARAPVAMNRLVAVTGDLRSPVSLLSPVVVSSLVFPPSRRSR